jgi:hypothetical protein
VSDARVRVPGTATMAKTDQLGRYTLPLGSMHSGKVVVSAGKEGWFNNAVIAGKDGWLNNVVSFSTQKKSRPIPLYPVPRGDNKNYRFISPVQCAQCHNTLARYWDKSKMAHTTSNPKVIAMYTGSGKSGVAGPGYQLDNPEKVGSCVSCHAPSAAVTNGAPKNLLSALRSKAVEWDGISCDYCHKVQKVVRDDNSPSRKRPLFRRLQAPNSNAILVFGPYDDVVNGVMAASYSSVYEKSVFCATCHDHFEKQVKPVEWQPEKVYSEKEWQSFGLTDSSVLPVQSTYQEWKLWQNNLSPEDLDRGKSCQSCHMSWRKDMLPYDEYVVDGRVRQTLGTKRAPTTIHPHQFDGTTPVQLKSALSLELEGAVKDSEFVVKVHVTNVGAGHWVPTGETMRSIMLVVDGVDSQGNPLNLIAGERLPDWAGKGRVEKGNFAGLPGAIFAKVLRGADGTLNVPSWRAVAIDSDTRIRPKSTVTMEFRFALSEPDDEPSVEAKLVYRPAFKKLADSKGWNDMDVTLASRVW